MMIKPIQKAKPSFRDRFGVCLIGVMLVLGFSLAGAQSFDAEKDVEVELLASQDGLPAGDSADLAVVFRVPEGYHITSLETGFFFVEFDSSAGLTFTPAEFPKPQVWHEEDVYQGEIIVRSKVAAALDVEMAPRTIHARIGYQICSETGTFQCFFPVERELTLDLPILSKDLKPQPMNATIFGALAATPSETANTGLVGSFETALARGSFMALLLVFIGGILASFTPCVYPIIPITISYIGSRAAGNKFGGFILSLFFVLGLAVMYSSLGIIAALTGGVFGGLTQNPIVYGILIVIFIVMGISMMGAFDLQLPASWQGKLQSGQRKGVIGAVFMGMAAGLIAAPCVGPILVALLTWVAKTGSVIVGFGLLFSFSLGMGLLFIVIGTFAGAITALPKAGQWMESVKHVFAWLLWGTAVYFAQFVLPKSWMPLLWAAFLMLLGIYVGAFKPFAEHNWRWILSKWMGLLAVLAGAFFLLFGLSKITGWPQVSPGTAAVAAAEMAPNWIVNDEEGAFAKAASEGKPLMMDFYADWCVACVELDHKTYNRPEVLSRAEKFVTLKMDFTRQDDWSKQMTEKYGVKGMPTVIFFSPDGKEIERFVGFKDAPAVAQIMDRVF
jgi:thiol:disulfide interchange protein DsbD